MGSSYSNCLKSISGRDWTNAAKPEVGVVGKIGKRTREVGADRGDGRATSPPGWMWKRIRMRWKRGEEEKEEEMEMEE